MLEALNLRSKTTMLSLDALIWMLTQSAIKKNLLRELYHKSLSQNYSSEIELKFKVKWMRTIKSHGLKVQ